MVHAVDCLSSGTHRHLYSSEQVFESVDDQAIAGAWAVAVKRAQRRVTVQSDDRTGRETLPTPLPLGPRGGW